MPESVLEGLLEDAGIEGYGPDLWLDMDKKAHRKLLKALADLSSSASRLPPVENVSIVNAEKIKDFKKLMQFLEESLPA